jgi:cytochrome o ubiquinol oxidase operon protein cyoD
MSSIENPNPTTSKHEHGTLRSYIIGFLLSLIFTFIPYFLVVNKVISGNALIATILGFGTLQMIIQLVFFLHLGRERKPRWQLLFLIGTVIGILTVVGGSLWIMRHLHYNMTVTPTDASKKLINDEAIYQVEGQKTGACEEIGENHQVIIKDSVARPSHTDAALCDTLTFINEDTASREMTFGTHPSHGVYAGLSEVVVRNGRNETITLSESGGYQFHDHKQAETAGSFTVTPR